MDCIGGSERSPGALGANVPRFSWERLCLVHKSTGLPRFRGGQALVEHHARRRRSLAAPPASGCLPRPGAFAASPARCTVFFAHVRIMGRLLSAHLIG